MCVASVVECLQAKLPLAQLLPALLPAKSQLHSVCTSRVLPHTRQIACAAAAASPAELSSAHCSTNQTHHILFCCCSDLQLWIRGQDTSFAVRFESTINRTMSMDINFGSADQLANELIDVLGNDDSGWIHLRLHLSNDPLGQTGRYYNTIVFKDISGELELLMTQPSR
jgi:hypothetical protein